MLKWRFPPAPYLFFLTIVTGLYGSNNMENTKCDIIIETTFDVFNAMVKLHFEKDEAKKVRIS